MNLQKICQVWAEITFPSIVIRNTKERSARFIEEALELVQANDFSKEDVLKLVDYVYSRPIGDLNQEVGGVMVTLSVLASHWNIDIIKSGEKEIERCFNKIEEIRKKQQFKKEQGIEYI